MSLTPDAKRNKAKYDREQQKRDQAKKQRDARKRAAQARKDQEARDEAERENGVGKNLDALQKKKLDSNDSAPKKAKTRRAKKAKEVKQDEQKGPLEPQQPRDGWMIGKIRWVEWGKIVAFCHGGSGIQNPVVAFQNAAFQIATALDGLDPNAHAQEQLIPLSAALIPPFTSVAEITFDNFEVDLRPGAGVFVPFKQREEA